MIIEMGIACRNKPANEWPILLNGSSLMKYSKSGDILPNINPVVLKYFGFIYFNGAANNACDNVNGIIYSYSKRVSIVRLR